VGCCFGFGEGGGGDVDADVVFVAFDLRRAQPEFFVRGDGVDDVCGGEVEAELADGEDVEFQDDIAGGGGPDVFDPVDQVAEEGLLDAAFDDAGGGDVRFADEVDVYDWGGDEAGAVYDFFDSGHTLRNAYVGDAGEMEGLQGHLSAWLSD